MTDLSELDRLLHDQEVEDRARELVGAELREQRARVMLLREAVALALGVIDGTSTRVTHDLIIVRAILDDTGVEPAQNDQPTTEEEGK